MEENNRFYILLQSYLDSVVSEKEYRELMDYIRSGAYDEYLKQEIEKRSNDTNTDVPLPVERTDSLLQKVITAEKYFENVVPVLLRQPKKWLKPLISTAAIVLALLGIWWIFKNKNSNATALIEQKTAFQQKEETKKFIQLEDGSTVLLNEKSQLTYSDKFGDAKREVTLKGEGYFDIVHDPSKPFIVHAEGITTTVLGTAFNIKAYPNQREIIVTVTRGKVKVSRAAQTLAVLIPNRQLAIDSHTFITRETIVNTKEVTEWKDDFLVLNNISLEDAAILIGNKYHVTISFANERLKECRITSTFLSEDSLEHVLAVVCGVVDAFYIKQPNDQIIINGTGCE